MLGGESTLFAVEPQRVGAGLNERFTHTDGIIVIQVGTNRSNSFRKEFSKASVVLFVTTLSGRHDDSVPSGKAINKWRAG